MLGWLQSHCRRTARQERGSSHGAGGDRVLRPCCPCLIPLSSSPRQQQVRKPRQIPFVTPISKALSCRNRTGPLPASLAGDFCFGFY